MSPATVERGRLVTDLSAMPETSATPKPCARTRTSEPLIPPLAPPSMREPEDEDTCFCKL